VCRAELTERLTKGEQRLHHRRGRRQAPGRRVHWALWVAQIPLALVSLAVSYPKVTLDPVAVDGFAAMRSPADDPIPLAA
jgi:hypothetical protein